MKLLPYCRPTRVDLAIIRSRKNGDFQETKRARRYEQEYEDWLASLDKDWTDEQVVEFLNVPNKFVAGTFFRWGGDQPGDTMRLFSRERDFDTMKMGSWKRMRAK